MQDISIGFILLGHCILANIIILIKCCGHYVLMVNFFATTICIHIFYLQLEVVKVAFIS